MYLYMYVRNSHQVRLSIAGGWYLIFAKSFEVESGVPASSSHGRAAGVRGSTGETAPPLQVSSG